MRGAGVAAFRFTTLVTAALGACGGPAAPRHPQPDSDTVVDVTLTPGPGATGVQRVNFAVPLARGRLEDPDRVRVLSGGVEISAARRALASYPDGSVRSVQLQIELPVTDGQVVQVRLGEAPATAPLDLVDVSTTLVVEDGTRGPRVWARLPAAWLSASGVAGPQLPEAATRGAAAGAWDAVCDYERHGIAAFFPLSTGMKDIWLFDRGTVFYRGHARRGDLDTLVSAYRETALYRARMTGAGPTLRIGVPDAADDLKYHYTQGLAIHYLLTGDDRFRESAEAIADRAAALWTSPGYAGGEDFWTERHAGFALLAYVWAGIVTDDRADDFAALADRAVDAYLAIPGRYPAGWPDAGARCFAHQAAAHGEDYGTWGCSPWMSAILADALDAYASERDGTRAAAARTAIVELGTLIAREARDSNGRPYYWLALGPAADEPDDHDEHWGEAAYVVAMAWYWGGRKDASLRTAAEQLLRGLAERGSAPHLRSFNWQCRSAVGAAFYLR